jgi:hypothetical protein
MERSYAIEKVLKEDLPNLQHGNDGLIYTCAESVYVPGTDERMLVSSLRLLSLFSQTRTVPYLTD